MKRRFAGFLGRHRSWSWVILGPWCDFTRWRERRERCPRWLDHRYM